MDGVIEAIIIAALFISIVMLCMRQESKRYFAKQPRTFAELKGESDVPSNHYSR